MPGSKRTCSIDGCARQVSYKDGLCSGHARRLRLYGDPLAGRFEGLGRQWILDHVEHTGDECLIWPFGRQNGYACVRWPDGQRRAHRVMCGLAHGPAPTPDHEAAHSCGKGHRGCIHPGHLRWATPLENQRDRFLHGTDSRGERHACARLTRAQVIEIRALIDDGRSDGELGVRFGVRSASINNIRHRRSWAWLEEAA